MSYVESQAHEEVVHLEKVASELVGPVRHDIWDVPCSESRWCTRRFKATQLIERCINKLKGYARWQAVTTTDYMYRGIIDIASIRIWLRDPGPCSARQALVADAAVRRMRVQHDAPVLFGHQQVGKPDSAVR
jgi:hypothetical protein